MAAGLTQSGTGWPYSCTNMATVGVKGLITYLLDSLYSLFVFSIIKILLFQNFYLIFG